jgi:hypothetical protein
VSTASDRQSAVNIPHQASPAHDDGIPPAETRRGRRALIAGGTVLALLAGGGFGARHHLKGDVPRGVTVLGVDLGGLTRAEAGSALRAHLAADPRTTAAVRVRVEAKSATVSPAAIGLVVDVDATVEAATGGRPSLFGSRRTVAPVIAVDADLLDAALLKAVGRVGTPMKAPAVTFTGLTPEAVHPAPGRGLDPRRSAEAVRAGWLSGAPITVPLVDVRAAVASRLARIEVPAKDASFAFAGGKPRIVAGAEGRALDLAALAPQLLIAAQSRDARTVKASLTTAAPATSAADLAKLGVKEKVSTFTTRFTGGLSSPRS